MYRTALSLTASTLIATAAFAQTTTAPTSPAPAGAQTAPAAPAAGAAPTVGATIYDAQGAVVGTIASIAAPNAVIDTGTVKAAVPLASFGTSPKGPTLGLNKAQLEAAAGQQAGGTDIRAKLVAGAPVSGVGGTPVGTIKSVEGEFVTLTTTQGDARLPISGFGPTASGGIAIGLTADQLAAAIGGAKAASPAPAGGPDRATNDTVTPTTPTPR